MRTLREIIMEMDAKDFKEMVAEMGKTFMNSALFHFYEFYPCLNIIYFETIKVSRNEHKQPLNEFKTFSFHISINIEN